MTRSTCINRCSGSLDATGADVHIVVSDAAGNQGAVVQHVRYDGTAPMVSLQASPVHDEASEVPTFSATPASLSTDEVPSHIHGGAVVDLATTGGCPSITKYSYLLGAAPPPYGAEPNGRNPLLYQVLVADDGVGIDPTATQYRVGRDDPGGTTQWVTAWTPVGTGTTVAPGVTGYAVPVGTGTAVAPRGQWLRGADLRGQRAGARLAGRGVQPSPVATITVVQ